MSGGRNEVDGGAAGAPEEPPPLLGSWRRIYAVLLLELLATVVALYALARWAA